LKLAKQKKKFVVVNASDDIDTVHKQVVEVIGKFKAE
jgi:thymidylate kinase